MKKILLLLLTLGLGFTLIGCDVIKKDDPKKDDEIEDIEKPGEEDETPPVVEDEDEVPPVIINILTLNKNFTEKLTGNNFEFDNINGYTKIKIYGTTTNTSTSDGNTVPAKANIFINNIKFDNSDFNLNIGNVNQSWADGKTHIVENIKFYDYQIREKYNGIGVRVPNIDIPGDSRIEIDVTNINNIKFDLFSSISGIDPDIITIYIEITK